MKNLIFLSGNTTTTRKEKCRLKNKTRKEIPLLIFCFGTKVTAKNPFFFLNLDDIL
jgi:hypothetical protein